MEDTLFSFAGVSVVRDSDQILSDVSITIGSHGLTALSGASGSGKSTLLRCCNRLESITRGRVSYRGRSVLEIDPRHLRRKVAMVFQQPTVFPGTALANLQVADSGVDRDLGAELFERVGLSVELLERPAQALSGGEAQRLCLARALASRPEVILADEVTSALDPDSARHLERLARSLVDRGVPVVWVTHDREQRDRIADRVIELDHGRVVGERSEVQGRTGRSEQGECGER